jgi:hypothetical protein
MIAYTGFRSILVARPHGYGTRNTSRSRSVAVRPSVRAVDFQEEDIAAAGRRNRHRLIAVARRRKAAERNAIERRRERCGGIISPFPLGLVS